MCVCARAYVCVCVCVCARACVSLCVSVSVRVCSVGDLNAAERRSMHSLFISLESVCKAKEIPAHTHTHIHTHRERDKHARTHAQRQV